MSTEVDVISSYENDLAFDSVLLLSFGGHSSSLDLPNFIEMPVISKLQFQETTKMLKKTLRNSIFLYFLLIKILIVVNDVVLFMFRME